MAKKEKSSSGSGKGLIQAGGDPRGYLGHFRNKDTIKRGHNQGDPSGVAFGTGAPATPIDPSHPAMNPLSNPEGFKAAVDADHPMLTGRAKPMAARQVRRSRPQRASAAAAPAAKAASQTPAAANANAQRNLQAAVGSVRQTRRAIRSAMRGEPQTQRTPYSL